MRKFLFCLSFLMLFPSCLGQNIQVNIYTNGNDNYSASYREDYVYYKNPPRQSLMTNGWYVMSSSKLRYVHSPSRLKAAKQAARINYYNDMYD